MYFLTYVIYIIINVIVSLLQTSCIIELDIARFIVFISGVVFLLLQKYRIMKLKKDCGHSLFELEREIKTSPIFGWGLSVLNLLLIILCSLLLYRIPESLPLSMLIFLSIYELYFIFFEKPVFTEKGLLISGILIEWHNFKSYNWNVPSFNKLKDYTKLVMTKNNWFGTYKINLIIINSQKVELDNFLRQKIRTNLFQD
ncbi:hypothetical protein [Desulfitobacterium hafniense]|uniref:hypothetical protein n=1 Tax=Desulfitobacterium hafniense TaxID=49338 RepID=UPI00037656F1|nr:hypothetical protein [Desulfitobacterium hafniense]